MKKYNIQFSIEDKKRESKASKVCFGFVANISFSAQLLVVIHDTIMVHDML